MPNAVYDSVVNELEIYVGDILAVGMTKKALQKVGTTADDVTAMEMKRALAMHIKPHLTSFMGPDKIRELVGSIEKKIQGVA